MGKSKLFTAWLLMTFLNFILIACSSETVVEEPSDDGTFEEISGNKTNEETSGGETIEETSGEETSGVSFGGETIEETSGEETLGVNSTSEMSEETSGSDRCPDLEPGSPPAITIENATNSFVSGCVSNIDPSSIVVAFFAKTDQWYVQPFVDDPYTEVTSDGYWESFTHPWGALAAYIVTPGLPMPATSNNTLPLEVDGENVLAMAVYPPDYLEQITRSFSGYTWYVKMGNGLGPGPNNWSASLENVWIDEEGSLHLKITNKDGLWWCAEVYLPDSLGFGKYTFTISSRIDLLDPQAVGAPFIYRDDFHEIDVEFSRWGDPTATENAQYVIQPYDYPGNLERFQITLSDAAVSTHQILWNSDLITFRSVQGTDIDSEENLIHAWEYTGPDIPEAEGMLVHINLWLFLGMQPISGEEQEMVVSSFLFTPE